METRTAAAESGLNLGCKTFQLYTIAKAYEKYCKIQAILRRYQCPPTHIYSFWFFDTALAATWLRSDYPTARAIARAHRYDVYANENRMRFLPLRQFMLQGLDAVLACSNDGANYLRERYGADVLPMALSIIAMAVLSCALTTLSRKNSKSAVESSDGRKSN
ncbi:hypothetical protein [Bifidobacterium animalis]|uniref:hypothetical protein n=1 Tax=Bifidobacterium animalis TaxID=28025 RepID=UPI0011D252A9|nr:hypothetical protein [Bifidobacterium animalis]UBZ01289.1 hypothetical protein LDH92_07150 [Bifidobacterium animalis subsp. lactis]